MKLRISDLATSWRWSGESSYGLTSRLPPLSQPGPFTSCTRIGRWMSITYSRSANVRLSSMHFARLTRLRLICVTRKKLMASLTRLAIRKVGLCYEWCKSTLAQTPFSVGLPFIYNSMRFIMPLPRIYEMHSVACMGVIYGPCFGVEQVSKASPFSRSHLIQTTMQTITHVSHCTSHKVDLRCRRKMYKTTVMNYCGTYHWWLQLVILAQIKTKKTTKAVIMIMLLFVVMPRTVNKTGRMCNNSHALPIQH